jgi:hypothetical protein
VVVKRRCWNSNRKAETPKELLVLTFCISWKSFTRNLHELELRPV